jgi:hypothetical protein
MRANASRGDLFVASNDALETTKLNTAAKSGAAIESATFPGLNFIRQHLSSLNPEILVLFLQDPIPLSLILGA